MATGKARRGARRFLRIALVLATLTVVGAWYYREPISGYSGTATAYSARVICACRHVDGRTMRQCKADLHDPRLSLVFLTQDAQERSVTARVPLLSTQTATYKPGWGCVLEPWKD